MLAISSVRCGAYARGVVLLSAGAGGRGRSGTVSYIVKRVAPRTERRQAKDFRDSSNIGNPAEV